MAALSGFTGCSIKKTPNIKKPNIVYILCDDMGYGDLSCLNENSKVKTPNMDEIAREGMIFTDAHSSSSVCTPTRYGLLTGRYNWRSRLKNGVLGGYSTHLIDPDRMTVADLLRDNGYYTACIGKWHLGWDWTKKSSKLTDVDFTGPVTNGPDVNGFDYYYAHCGSLDMAPYVYVQNGKATAQPDRETESKDKYGWWRKGPTASDFHHEDVTPNFARRGAKYIKERATTGKPFFLYLPLPSPHTPILPTKEFQGKSGINPYCDFVMLVDDCIGRITKAIDDSGVKENTIIILTADNGCSPAAKIDEMLAKDHNPSYKFRGHKADIYEGGHRIPFILRWPAAVKAGSHCNDTTCLVDLMATCADILNVEIPDNAAEDSVSMLPNLLGTATGPVREATVHHSINGSFSIRQGKWKLELCGGSGGWSAPRPGKATEGLPPVQLYDLSKDIAEKHNLQDKHPDVVKRLTALLQQYVDNGRSTPGKPQTNEGQTPIMKKTK
ncbi:MAG: arylsulfatase [Phycisphaerae bacterium]|nr:arylsulfatase [Phycisphaerae bacterium]